MDGNPQVENGYTRIANEIMEALAKYKIPGEPGQCLKHIFRQTYGWRKIESQISLDDYMNATGLKKPTVCRAIKWLTDKNIVIKNDNYSPPMYSFNKKYKTWKPLSKKIIIIKNDNRTIKDNIYIEEKKSKKKKPSPDIPWPSDFILTDEMKEYAIAHGIARDKVGAFFEDFHNWADQNEKTYKNWEAGFRTRVGKAPEMGKQFMISSKVFNPKANDGPVYKDGIQVLKDKGML